MAGAFWGAAPLPGACPGRIKPRCAGGGSAAPRLGPCRAVPSRTLPAHGPGALPGGQGAAPSLRFALGRCRGELRRASVSPLRKGRLSSTSSTSSCSSEFSGEVIPHGPDLPKSDPGQWWASFFFGKTTHPAMTTVSEPRESPAALRVAGAAAACGLVAAQGRRRSEPGTGAM
uniref:Pancreatic progenitor cell differentiation and proliferation factor n=1 Tax=Taeniopygia guttata TaxID=59729 RepID=A0A674HA56_TAEGU